MAARGSERVAEILEELIVELPARLRGGRARLSDQALGLVRALAAEPTPELVDVVQAAPSTPAAQASREKRRQRRRSRPHGRAR